MARVRQHSAARRLALAAVPVTIALLSATAAVGAPTGSDGSAVVASQPPDRQNYVRTAQAGDRLVRPALPAGYALVDTVVSNTDPNLRNSDTYSGEKNVGIQPSAISPARAVFLGPIAAR